MRQEVLNYSRQEIFDHYNSKTNPFIILTTKIDITNIYKNNKDTYYGTIGYYIAKAANQIDSFKYRYENNKIYYYDYVDPNFTQMFKNGNIGYFTCKYKNNIDEFIEEYKKKEEKFLTTNTSYANDSENEIWLSCEPWLDITSLIPPFDKKTTIPQFIWDKFKLENGRCYVNLMIMVHHGFADGKHIGMFIQKLNDIIDNIQ